MTRPWRLYSLLIGIAAVVFMLAPLALVILFAFARNPLMTFPLGGLTLDWYGRLLGDPAFWAALRNSVVITLFVGLLSTVGGTMAAAALSRLPPRRSELAMATLALPLMMPPLVLALALLSLFSALGLRLGLDTVVVAHLVFTMPFVILVVAARLADFDHAMVESARDLGASPVKTFMTVTFPIVRPTIFGAALIAMALSLDDFVITFFMIGGGNTLPTLIWGMLRSGVDPTINALATLVMAATIGTASLALRLTRFGGCAAPGREKGGARRPAVHQDICDTNFVAR